MQDNLKDLSNALPGRRVVVLDVIGSTNDAASAMAEGKAEDGKPAAHGTVVVAEQQTEGRGRLGRRWESPKGVNLYMSVVLRPALPARDTPLLCTLTAVACASALEALTNVDVSLKWPNDILVERGSRGGGGKLGGILLESRTEGEKLLYAIAGIGINVNMEPKTLPLEIQPIATSLFIETKKKHSRVDLAAGILQELDQWLSVLKHKGSKPLLDKWRDLDAYAGEVVTLGTSTETVTGVSRGVDEAGRLVLKASSGEVRTFTSGELLKG